MVVILYFPVSDSCDLAGHVFQSAPNQNFGVEIVNCTTFLTPFFEDPTLWLYNLLNNCCVVKGAGGVFRGKL